MNKPQAVPTMCIGATCFVTLQHNTQCVNSEALLRVLLWIRLTEGNTHVRVTWTKKNQLTTFALLNHVHRLTGLKADLRVLLPLVVGHGHVLLQHHRLRAVNPWGEETGCQPPARRGTPRTPTAANYTAAVAAVHPVRRHRPIPSPPHCCSPWPIRTWAHDLAASSQMSGHIAESTSGPQRRTEEHWKESKQKEGPRRIGLQGQHLAPKPDPWPEPKLKIQRKRRRGKNKKGEIQELLTTGREDWGASEWKNGEVSLWKINSAVEWKGLPSTVAGSQPLDRETGGGVNTPIMVVGTAGLK